MWRLWIAVPALAVLAVLIAPVGNVAATKKHMKTFKKKYPKVPTKLLRCKMCHLKKKQKLPSDKRPNWMFVYRGNEKGELVPEKATSKSAPQAKTPASTSKPPTKKLPQSVMTILGKDAKNKKPHNYFGLQLFMLGGKKRPFAQRLAAARLLDADGDGYPNDMELLTGHRPADASDKPTDVEVKKAGLKPPVKPTQSGPKSKSGKGDRAATNGGRML